MLTIVAAFGTRPEAIKFAPVIWALRKRPDEFDVHVVATNEQPEPLQRALELFEIEPDVVFESQEGAERGERLAHSIAQLSAFLTKIRPDVVLVLGDTATTLATTIAAYYLQIKVAYIEAGIRTDAKFGTFPEEGHRLMVSSVADIYFAPTDTSRQHLLAEGVEPDHIFVTGNTSIDALRWVHQRLSTLRESREILLPELFREGATERVSATFLKAVRGIERGESRAILISGRRPETFGTKIQSICGAISRLADTYPNDLFIYPLELDDNLKQTVHALLGDRDNVFLLPALAYLPFQYLMSLAHLVISDSGSIQEEAAGLHTPVLVMRSTTDRPEAIQAGSVTLVGTDAINIVSAARRLLDNPERHRRACEAPNPFGDGQAAERIVEVLLRWSIRTGPSRENEVSAQAT